MAAVPPTVIIYGNPVAQPSLVVTPSSGSHLLASSNPLLRTTLAAQDAFAVAAKAQAEADAADLEARAAEILATQKRAHATALKAIAASKNALAASQLTVAQPTVVALSHAHVAPGSRRNRGAPF